jgi:hypothetical protein
MTIVTQLGAISVAWDSSRLRGKWGFNWVKCCLLWICDIQIKSQPKK